MLIKALLVAVWAGICAWDQYGPHLGFRKPLLAGAVTGLILGDLTQGLIIGATLELMWLGSTRCYFRFSSWCSNWYFIRRWRSNWCSCCNSSFIISSTT